MKAHAKQIFWNTMLLTAASLLMRTVGVGFQVFVSNRAGAEAMGLYSLLFGVYGFALTLATSGIYLSVTKTVVENLGLGKKERIYPTMVRAVILSFAIGLFASFLLFGFAEPVGVFWLKDTRTVKSLKLLSATLPLISVSSACGGYFTALRQVWKNAATQVLEQAVKIGVTMFFLLCLSDGDVESTCCYLVLGGAVAEVLSFFAELTLYLLDRKKYKRIADLTAASAEQRKLVKIAVPIALTTYARSGLVTLEHILIPEGLRNSGASHASALIAYGSIHSMALPIILYPAALITSFAGLLVPELTEANVQNSEKRISYMISRVFSFSLTYSIGVAGILLCFSPALGTLLYPNTDTSLYLRILSPLIPIMYVDTAADAILKGLGEQVASMKINVADAFLSVVLVYFLVPKFGINGYVITIYFSEFFNTVLSILKLLSVKKVKIKLFQWIYAPLLSVVGATVAVGRLFSRFSDFSAPGKLVLLMTLCTILYCVLLFALGAFKKEDLIWMRGWFSKKEPLKLPPLQSGVQGGQE